MKRRIENGVTIISTGDAVGGQKPKSGIHGVYFYKPNGMYKSDIDVNHKKYHIGFFQDKEMAGKARRVAEIRKADGTFLKWFPTKPHGNDDNFYDFWENEFQYYGL